MLVKLTPQIWQFSQINDVVSTFKSVHAHSENIELFKMIYILQKTYFIGVQSQNLQFLQSFKTYKKYVK